MSASGFPGSRVEAMRAGMRTIAREFKCVPLQRGTERKDRATTISLNRTGLYVLPKPAES